MLQRAMDLGEWLSRDPVRSVATGRSPHTIIHRQNKAAVRFFAQQGEQKARPLFISMPLINTWTIFDLLPGKSVVEALRRAGVPVYVLDWGHPGPEDQQQDLVETIDSILVRALQRSTRHARGAGLLSADELPDALGYCVGGSFLSICLSRHPGLARRMALLAAPIDFHKAGRLCDWARPDHFPVDDIVDSLGNFPAHMMRDSFAWMKPVGQTRKWRSLWDRYEQPGFPEVWAAMEQWNGDNTDFPGETYRQYIKLCYFENGLVKGGQHLGGRPVDLRAATIPALAIAAEDDHICPPAAAFGLQDCWGGPVEVRQIKGGHVGVCLGRALHQLLIDWCRT
jgi:polyhydroxyalkanoate synthase subunit PhaC